MIRLAVVVALAVVASATLAAAAPPPRSATTGATAYLVRITVPGQAPISLGELDWPDSTAADVQSFQYPADGSVVSVGRSRAAVFASPGAAAAAQSFAEAIVVSLFNGEIVAGKVTASVSAGASARSVGIGHVCFRRARSAGTRPGRRRDARYEHVARGLGHAHGSLCDERQPEEGAAGGAGVSHGASRAPDGGPRRPPGRERDRRRGRPGDRRRRRRALHLRQRSPARDGRPPSAGHGRTLPRAPEPDVGGEVPGGPVRVAPEVSARLSSGGFVFPVYGTASFGDSFGAPRRGRARRLASRRGHLRRGSDAAPRGRGRDAPHDRLQPHRRLPALAPGRRRRRVLLRASLRLLAARRGGQAGQGGRRDRLRRSDG